MLLSWILQVGRCANRRSICVVFAGVRSPCLLRPDALPTGAAAILEKSEGQMSLIASCESAAATVLFLRLRRQLQIRLATASSSHLCAIANDLVSSVVIIFCWCLLLDIRSVCVWRCVRQRERERMTVSPELACTRVSSEWFLCLLWTEWKFMLM